MGGVVEGRGTCACPGVDASSPAFAPSTLKGGRVKTPGTRGRHRDPNHQVKRSADLTVWLRVSARKLVSSGC